MDRLCRAQGRFIRAGIGPADRRTDGAGVTPRKLSLTSRGARGALPSAPGGTAGESGESMPRRLDALAAAAMALGWECVQAAVEEGSEPLHDLDPEGLSASVGPTSARPGTAADWARFDAAWGRVGREIGADDLTGVGLALLDFAQACRITADRLEEEPVARRASA